MRQVKVSAPAKVNLALRVGPPRLDGFHPLDTVFESLDLFDDVTATENTSGNVALQIEGLGEDLPTDSSNLAVRAAHLLREHCGVTHGVDLHILKRIPVAGGMAGGSADAAGTLVACNELWSLGLSQGELLELGAQLGSDVPFAILGGLAHGRGRGEKLEPIRPGTMHSWVILAHPDGLSTPDVFREFDAIMGYEKVSEELVADTVQLREALQGSDVETQGALMVNDLEEAAFSLRPDVRAVVRTASQYGVKALLSGSGPSVAVLADDFATADVIAGKLSRELPELTVLRVNGPAAGTHIRP
ncbi:4-(cytidine 5'-diphospho)-2-C-methyl-D-erythritol kinase [Arcanobacterium haemolyticum]|nr:4-(cytidine 5'-diphospho)-2-C-methyl-D-erythritol kinase [Arcanobacterium haemolyticum]